HGSEASLILILVAVIGGRRRSLAVIGSREARESQPCDRVSSISASQEADQKILNVSHRSPAAAGPDPGRTRTSALPCPKAARSWEPLGGYGVTSSSASPGSTAAGTKRSRGPEPGSGAARVPVTAPPHQEAGIPSRR